jgi:hypothetical protein
MMIHDTQQQQQQQKGVEEKKKKKVGERERENSADFNQPNNIKIESDQLEPSIDVSHDLLHLPHLHIQAQTLFFYLLSIHTGCLLKAI